MQQLLIIVLLFLLCTIVILAGDANDKVVQTKEVHRDRSLHARAYKRRFSVCYPNLCTTHIAETIVSTFINMHLSSGNLQLLMSALIMMIIS